MDWSDVFRLHAPVLEILIRGTAVYIGLFGLLRFVLRREAGALSVTDLLVVVLIADAAQNAMASDDDGVGDGLVLVSVIVFWAWALDWLGWHVPFLGRILKPPKLLLVKDGRLLVKHMRRELVTREELMSELRQRGIDELARVRRAYIEPDGQFSVLVDDRDRPGTSAPSS